jgi:NTP pyrophosphatase (non-canonical NTP hydrolase)
MEKFKEYQQQAMTTCLPSCRNLNYMIAGLCSEAGEVAGVYKKHIRGDYEYEKARIAMAKELGDVLWYCAGIAEQINYPLSDIAQMNIAKLASRKERGKITGNGDER